MTKKLNKRSDCPISRSLDIWGDKWSLLIIRNIMFQNMHTYGEFLSASENIATNILANRLVSLEQAGLITKEEHSESRSKFFYTLTQKGINLLPVMVEITLWGNKYFEISQEAKELVKRAKHNKETLIKSHSAQLKKLRT
jgi:DNA-binding HxlR family transcriptional regulator